VHYGRRPQLANQPAWLAAATSARPQPRGFDSAARPTEPVQDLQVRPEYRQSGQWRDDAPSALTGR
jgi:hypothetical protein